MPLDPEKFKSLLESLQSSLIDIKRFKYDPDKIIFHVDRTNTLTFRYINDIGVARIMKDKVNGKFNHHEGIIAESLSSSAKRNLESLKISYLTFKGDFCLYFDDRVVKCAHSKPFSVDKRNSATLNLLKATENENEDLKFGIPAPTDFISPYGLEILDVIFRMAPWELERITPYRLCKDFHLNSARLFRMQSSLGTKSLEQFQYAIRKLPMSWWKTSLTYPRTHQRLNSFQRNAENYVSVGEGKEEERLYNAIAEIREIYGEYSIIPGPVETLKRLGLISVNETQLWLKGDDTLKKLKQILRLTPSNLRGRGENISISVLKSEDEFLKQCILSKAGHTEKFPSEVRELNIFRVIWDACNFDSRTENAALEFLKRGVLK